ncbi:MAG: hypothetical protein ACYTFY_08415 [Planctomycetota bacterium]|jgi:hypothetical protein
MKVFISVRSAGISAIVWALFSLTVFIHSAIADKIDGKNLIRNGSFEKADPEDAQKPANWSVTLKGEIKSSWASDRAKTGTRSVGLFQAPEAKYSKGHWFSDYFAVKRGMAYRVSFNFMAKGHGIPVFMIDGVKTWRLTHVDTDRKWIHFSDVIVIPKKKKKVRFSFHNYNRPGKLLWIDDVCVIELPLEDSPLSKRCLNFQADVAALGTTTADLSLNDQQKEELKALSSEALKVKEAYAKLKTGLSTDSDIETLFNGIENGEKALVPFKFMLWPVDLPAWKSGNKSPDSLIQTTSFTADLTAGDPQTLFFGLLNLTARTQAVTLGVECPNNAKWLEVALSSVSAYGDQALWGQLNPLGEFILPPGVPRLIKIDFKLKQTITKQNTCGIIFEVQELSGSMTKREFIIKTTVGRNKIK